MSRAARFLVPLIAVLGLLTLIASSVANRMTRQWFERDVQLRAQLALNGAREGLLRKWQAHDYAGMRKLLDDIARDRRLFGVAACAVDRNPIARSRDFPPAFSCRRIATLVRAPEAGNGGAWRRWRHPSSLRRRDLDITAIPVVAGGAPGAMPLGMMVFVHDMSFVTKRELDTENFYLVAFAVLALAASAFTGLVGYASQKSWVAQVRRLLRGEHAETEPEFLPILRDVRDLVGRLVGEAENGGAAGAWTPERLKTIVGRHLHGERIVVIANREPYIHERDAEGQIRVQHPASGLVTALEPVVRACSGVWVGHGSGSADRETADEHGRVAVPPGEESYAIRRVWLTREEERGYYYGFANEGLWPLCHMAHTRPIFRGDDWTHYQRVNRKFAAAACSESASEQPIVFVQDYHFAVVPRLIRARKPRATILTFWHIPWPHAEHFGICPLRNELLEGLLGSSILGFHTQLHCNNFLDSVDRFLEARIDRERHAVIYQGRTTLVRPYPISIEWPNHWVAAAPPAAECRARIFAELGLGPDAVLGVGVDRLDYTKGIEDRLRAVERALERFPYLRGRFTFVQIAAPSRSEIDRYQDLSRAVERLAASINERFGTASYRPIILRREHHEPPSVFMHYRAADLCYVSSLHDGMNLVAKEFVAARDDEGGVLVLSQFTGAARELTEALMVNPYDLEQASSALAAALSMPWEEQQERMRSMRAFLAEFNVYRWAGRMLVDAARLRQRDRFTEFEPVRLRAVRSLG